MSELWGFQSGQQQADETNLKMQMGALALTEGQQDIKQKEISLKTADLALQQQQTYLKKLASMGTSGGGRGAQSSDPVEGLASDLYAQSDAMAAAGMTEQAATVADKASRLELNHSKVNQTLKTKEVNMWGAAANALSNVHDHASLVDAFNAFTMEHPDMAENPQLKQLMMELQGRPYDQSKINAIRNAAISNKDQAETAAAAARAKASEASARRDDAQVPLEKARTVTEGLRAKALAKAGGKADALPKGTEVSYVMNHVTQDFNLDQDSDKAKARLVATDIASTADEIQKANEGMSRKDALDAAYKASKAGGNLSGLRPVDKSIGGNAGNALPLPKNNDLSKLEDNRWYVAPDEKGNMVPQLWTGSTFKTREALTLNEAEDDDAPDSDDGPDPDDEPAR